MKILNFISLGAGGCTAHHDVTLLIEVFEGTEAAGVRSGIWGKTWVGVGFVGWWEMHSMEDFVLDAAAQSDTGACVRLAHICMYDACIWWFSLFVPPSPCVPSVGCCRVEEW